MEMVIQKEWIASGDAPRGRSLLERVLMARGLETAAERRSFMDCSLDSLADPFELPGMSAAVQRLARAVRSGERVIIHGDYDADGVTATALLARLLRSLDTPVDCVIPDRLTDGYGISLTATEQVIGDRPAGLLVTVDCGISAAAEIARLTAMGIDVIVTDHHVCPPVLPTALAVINPRLPGSPYTDALAGVGVAYKLAAALCRELGCPGREQRGLDLVAVGTVADVMPLTGENRILVANGLAMLNAGTRIGLKALLAVSGSGERTVTAHTVGFSIGPRLNAAGRLGNARLALDLLLTDSPAEASRIATALDALNRDRQALEAEVLDQAIAEAERDTSEDGPLVVAREGWHHGIIGIVAARLTERYLRPAIVLSGENGIYRGSGRTWGSFDLLAAITAAAAHTSRYGGHRKAAGLTLTEEQLPDFRQQLALYGADHPDPERLRPTVIADLSVFAEELTLAAAHELEQLMPFGEENPEPLFIINRMRIDAIRTVGSNGRTLRLQLQAGEGPAAGEGFEAVGFNLGEAEAFYQPGEWVDLLFHLCINRFNGRETRQLVVRDLRPSDGSGTGSRQAASLVRPVEAADFRNVYTYLARQYGERPVLADLTMLGRRIGRACGSEIGGRQLQSVLAVLADARLVRLRPHDGERCQLQLMPATGPRVRLQDIPSYRRLMAREGGES